MLLPKKLGRSTSVLKHSTKLCSANSKKQLQLHREQVNREMQLSDKEELAMHHDRNLFPRQPTNKRGEKACDLHPAKDLLREIVRLNLHEGMKPSELQEATRGRPGNEFADFKPVKFKEKLRHFVLFFAFLPHPRPTKTRCQGLS